MKTLPELAGLDEIQSIKAEIEALEPEVLAQRIERLQKVVDGHKSSLGQLEKAHFDALDKLQKSRLSDVLNDAGGDDLKAAEDLARDARQKVRQAEVTFQRADIILKLCFERQQWLEANRVYRAVMYATPRMKAEYADAVVDVRERLGRLLALYVRLNIIRHPTAVVLDSFVQTELQTGQGLVTKAAVASHDDVVSEALELWDQEGRAKCEQEERKDAGREAVEQKYEHLQERMNRSNMSIKQIIRSNNE